jgi:hypothetical protein
VEKPCIRALWGGGVSLSLLFALCIIDLLALSLASNTTHEPLLFRPSPGLAFLTDRHFKRKCGKRVKTEMRETDTTSVSA